MKPQDRIIVSLDVPDLDQMKALVETLSPYVGCFKVGLEIITACGAPLVVDTIHSLGGKIFLDAKFHDIPNTVAAAARSAASLGVKMFNLHASAGLEAMKSAVQNKGTSLLLAVTVLTSMDEATCQNIYHRSVMDTVKSFAKEAAHAGVDGLVCSPHDLHFLNSEPSLESLLKITPGVRPVWADSNDQKRVLTPLQALQAGATALVIGRPITKPPSKVGSPVEAAKRILEEIS